MFRLNVRKTIEAVAILLRHSRKRMGRKRLLALLYIADRTSLERSGRPIVGGRLTARPYGPIHSEVYDFIKGGHREQASWSKFFENDGREVTISLQPSVHALSRFEVGILDEISNKFMGEDDWDIAVATHDFPEYKEIYVQNTSTPISSKELIKGVGRAKDADAILQDAQDMAKVDALLMSVKTNSLHKSAK